MYFVTFMHKMRKPSNAFFPLITHSSFLSSEKRNSGQTVVHSEQKRTTTCVIQQRKRECKKLDKKAQKNTHKKVVFGKRGRGIWRVPVCHNRRGQKLTFKLQSFVVEAWKDRKWWKRGGGWAFLFFHFLVVFFFAHISSCVTAWKGKSMSRKGNCLGVSKFPLVIWLKTLPTPADFLSWNFFPSLLHLPLFFPLPFSSPLDIEQC